MQLRVLAAHSARGLHLRCPLQSEGAGKTGCALHPRSRVRCAQTKVHTSIQGSGEHPAFPAQWLYGLFVLSPENGSFASVAPRSCCLHGHRRQHRGVRTTRLRRTLQPRSSVAAFASTASPRAFVTMANAPHRRETGGVMRLICAGRKRNIFNSGLDTFLKIGSDLPVGQLVAALIVLHAKRRYGRQRSAHKIPAWPNCASARRCRRSRARTAVRWCALNG